MYSDRAMHAVITNISASRKVRVDLSVLVKRTPPLSAICCIPLRDNHTNTRVISVMAAVNIQRMKHPFGLSNIEVRGPTGACVE